LGAVDGTLGTEVAGLGAPELKPPELTGADGAAAAGAALGVDGLLLLNPPDDDGLELGRENPPDDDGDDDRLLELLDDELLLELPAHDEPVSVVASATTNIAFMNFIRQIPFITFLETPRNQPVPTEA
jgi:hypothetical protein